MDTIFMNSEDSKISDPHRLLLHLSHKINMSLYQILESTIHDKI